MKVARLLLHPQLPGSLQMAIDEALYLTLKPEDLPVFRFYTWLRPTLSLGYFQNYDLVVNEPFCVHNNIDVVRRITGGRAVLHHLEVTYAVIAPLVSGIFQDQRLHQTYAWIAKALNRGLEQLGMIESSISLDSTETQIGFSGSAQCFVSVSKYELADRKKKVIGSAQKRSRDRFLQHGSILLDFDPVLQAGCVRNPDPAILQKIAPLNRVLNRSLSFEEVSDGFRSAFEETFRVPLVLSELTPEEQSVAKELEQKYSNRDWTLRGCR